MSKKSIIKSIGAVMMIMLVGKMLSLAANQVYLSYFGSDNEHINIYSYAIQIPNYLFQTFGTAVSSVVIPVFAALVAQKKNDDARRFGSNIITVSSALTLVLMSIGFVLAFLIPGRTSFEDKGYMTMALCIMMPVMLFYCLNFIYQGILQSLDNFTVPALVNLPSGILIILYIIFFADNYGVTGLLAVTVLGQFLQFAILVYPAKRAGFTYRPVFDLKDPGLRQAGKMTLPIIVGAGAYQLNMFFNNTLMTNVSPKSVSLFNFVQTLILSSVMTLVLAITSVMYPKLTAQAARGDNEGFRDSLSTTISSMVFLLLPITCGLVLVRGQFLSLISQWGNIGEADIGVESGFLFCYCLCIVFLGVKEIADRAFYSLKTTKISAITGVIIMAINIVLGYILSKYTPLGKYGIPLAYSIAASTGSVFLIIMLRRRIGYFGGRMFETVAKSMVSAVIMSVAVWGTGKLIGGFSFGGILTTRIVALIIPVAVGAAVYAASALILKIPTVTVFLDKLKHREEKSA